MVFSCALAACFCASFSSLSTSSEPPLGPAGKDPGAMWLNAIISWSLPPSNYRCDFPPWTLLILVIKQLDYSNLTETLIKLYFTKLNWLNLGASMNGWFPAIQGTSTGPTEASRANATGASLCCGRLMRSAGRARRPAWAPNAKGWQGVPGSASCQLRLGGGTYHLGGSWWAMGNDELAHL